MAIKPLTCYQRRVLLDASQLTFDTSKGLKLIIPGMIFGIRRSYDGTKIRCILNDDISKVFTLTYDDYDYLISNSISTEEAENRGII